jgi:hypothetical protein
MKREDFLDSIRTDPEVIKKINQLSGIEPKTCKEDQPDGKSKKDGVDEYTQEQVQGQIQKQQQQTDEQYVDEQEF